jgi:hypothetical protein
MSEKVLKVLANCAQGLTEEQKAQARANIGCAGSYSAGTGIAINEHSIINTAPNVKSDWNAATGSSAEILNKPSIGNGTLTIQSNGVQVAQFSANQSGNVTANITGVGGTDVVTRTNGQGGYVETSVSKLTLDTDFNQILTDGHEIGVFGPMPQSGDTGKMVVVNGDTLEYQTAPQAGTAIKTVSTTLPPVETDVSNMTLFDDGRVRVNNSTEIGLLAPTGGPTDSGKVLVGNYSGSPGKFVANWGDISALVSNYPQIDYMGHVTYNVNLSAANYLNMEDRVCYDIMSDAGGSYTLHLQTNSTTTVHSKIYLWGEQANCMSATIVYEDEGGEVSELQFIYGGTSENTIYALDVYARKVHVSGGISFDTTLARVYDYPCASRDIGSYNKDIGKVVEYVEPL